MLKILINKKEIFISKGTSIQMEVNNSMFSIDEIPGEIIYTFDVPAQQNDKIFNYARFVYVQKLKKYEAEILIGGVQIAKGDLYIQKATKKTYSLGLVVNSFPVGWVDKKLNESDYGEIIISKNSTEHKEKWLEFLKNSLKPDADIKFPLFVDENFYGGKNEEFGFVDGKQAYLQSILFIGEEKPVEKFYINRLFTNGTDVLDLKFPPGIKIFNKLFPEKIENSFSFAPAINLFYFIMLFFEKLDINAIGNFFNNEKLKKIYFQSLRALDGYNNIIKIGVLFKTKNKDELVSVDYPADFYDQPDFWWHNNVEYQKQKMNFFKAPKDGIVKLEIEVDIILYKDFFVKWNPFQIGEPLLIIYIASNNYENPAAVKYINSNPFLVDNKFNKIDKYLLRIYTKNQMKEMFGYDGSFDMICNFKFTENYYLTKNEELRFHVGRFAQLKQDGDYTEIYYAPPGYFGSKNLFPNLPVYFHNSFSSSIKLQEHTPNLNSGDFIRTIKNCFGLSLYIDHQTKQIEFLQIKDIFSAGYIQLDNYLLNDETYISEFEENEYTFKLPPVNDEEIDETRLISEVEAINDLDSAKNNFTKIAFVKNQNKYVESVKVGDAELNWKYIYQKYSGNNKEISVGKGEVQEITPSVLIPNMKDIDANIGATDVILEIDKTGVSPLFSTGTKDFELILINYTGRKQLSKNTGVFYESAQLVDSDTSKYDLSVIGDNSIGEIFIKPWLEFLAKHKNITHKFLFNLKTFLEVWQLFKPQHKPVEQQTRWVMVGSTKLLPKKMTFQFTEGKEYILAEIEFAKPRVEI